MAKQEIRTETRIISEHKRWPFVQAVVIVTDENGKRHSHTVHCQRHEMAAHAGIVRQWYEQDKRAA